MPMGAAGESRCYTHLKSGGVIWPDTEGAVHRDELYSAMPTEILEASLVPSDKFSRELMRRKGDEYFSNQNIDVIWVAMTNDHELPFRSSTPRERMKEVGTAYWQVVKKHVFDKRVKLISISLASSCSPHLPIRIRFR